MKRNSVAVSAEPRSFEELKRERSSARNASNDSVNNNNNVYEKHSTGQTDGAGAPAREDLAPQQPNDSPVFSKSKVSPAVQPTLHKGTQQRHDTENEEETVVSAPHSLEPFAHILRSPTHSVADTTPTTTAAAATRRTASGRERAGEGMAHETRRTNNNSSISSAHGIDLSKFPTTAALAAGARAAGAAPPFFSSLKLPPATTPHVGGPRNALFQATASPDNNNSACNSPHGSTAAGERRGDRYGAGYARTTSIGTPHKLDDTLGTTPRIPGTTITATVHGEGDHKGTLNVDRQPSPTLFPRDVGPLPASRTRARNRLPSGTHIRRRPRSVANRRPSGSGNVNAPLAISLMGSVDNMNFLSSTAYHGSPITSATDTIGAAAVGCGGGGTAGRNAFTSAQAGRPRGSGVTASGHGVGGGGRGTGHTRDVLPPGTRAAGAAVPHRNRTDPSPAPSRPPRARKAAAVIRAANHPVTPGTPALNVTPLPSAPTVSPSSPTQLKLATAASTSAASLSQQHLMWSMPNSPGAWSPLNNSLDTRCFLVHENEAAFESAGAVAAATAATTSTGDNLAPSSACAASHNNTRVTVAGSTAKPPSGPLISGAAAVASGMHTPRASITSLRGGENTPPRPDYAKLAEHYVQLCAVVGEPPNMEWVSRLRFTASEGGQQNQQHHARSNSTALTKEQQPSSSNFTVESSTEQKNLSTTQEHSLASILTAPHQSQQMLTPRGGGGARQRGSGVTAVTPRARTPTASRAKSPRGGAASTSTSTSATAKRSGSVGRITTLNRSSILGSSQAHSSGPATSPSSTLRETVADLCAQRVSLYCAERLQPYVDSIKRIQRQQQVLDDALSTFLSITASVITPNIFNNFAGGEAPCKSSMYLPANAASLSHRSHLGSGKRVPAASSPAPSSLSTTPRRLSTPRTSAASSLPNNNALIAATANLSCRPLSEASAKAASLTDGLQRVQGAVVALLSSLGDGAKLVHTFAATSAPSSTHEDGLRSGKSRRVSKSGGASASSHSALVAFGPATSSSPVATASHHTDSTAPAERPPTLGQPTTSCLSLTPTAVADTEVPPLTSHSGPVMSYLPLFNSIGLSGKKGGSSASAPVSCPTPTRFLDLFEAEKKAVAEQLCGVCEAVRAALGTSGSTGNTASSAPSESLRKTAVPATEDACGTAKPVTSSSVQLEYADMLDNPFFVPKKYLKNLAATLTSTSIINNNGHADAEAIPELNTPKMSTHSDANSIRTTSKGATTKSGKTPVKKSKNAKSSAGGGLGSTVSSDTVGSGGITKRSSAESTPRNPTSINIFVPFFTVRLPTEEITPNDNNMNSNNNNNAPPRLSVSSNGTENIPTMEVAAAASSSGFGEAFVLHCIQPTTATAGLTPRQIIDGDLVSGRQNLAQLSVSELGASATSVTSSIAGAATATTTAASLLSTTTDEKSTGCKTLKRATSVGTGKRGSGAGKRSKSGTSTRAGAAVASVGTPSLSETHHTMLSSSWLASQGNRGNVTGSSTSSPSGKRRRKKSSTSALNSAFSGSTHSHHHLQTAMQLEMQRQQQLAAAWKLWEMLEGRCIFSPKASGEGQFDTPDAAASRDSVVMGEKEKENGGENEEEENGTALPQPQMLPRPISASQNDTPPASPHVRVVGGAAVADADGAASTEGVQNSEVPISNLTPPTAKAPTAAATPVQALGAEMPEMENPRIKPPFHQRESNIATAADEPLESHVDSVGQRSEGAPSRTAGFAGADNFRLREGESGEEENDESVGFSYATTQVVENMAILSNGLRFPRRLDIEEENALHTQSDLLTASVSQHSSQATVRHAMSMTVPQRTALVSSPALKSDEDIVLSNVAAHRVIDGERNAVRQIVEWWRSVREGRRSMAQVRATHAAVNAQQQWKLAEARRRDFLLYCLCRLRLRRCIRAREKEEQQQQQRAEEERRARSVTDASDSETRSNSSSSKQTGKSMAAATLSELSPTMFMTSREKFLRSREHRKAMAAGGGVGATYAAFTTTSGTSSTGEDGKEVSAARVAPLPLASSGISTYAMNTYESDSSFTVAAIHRLMHAPPSLLYATCTVALHYPTHPPMAYLDNSSRAKSNSVEEAVRWQSEAPPDPAARMGAGAPGTCTSRHSVGREPLTRDGSAEAHGILWRTKATCFVRFRDLRRHLCAEYAACIPSRNVPAAMDCAHVGAATAASFSPLYDPPNSLAISYRGGSGRQLAGVTTLFIPFTMRYSSVVDANELHHRKPVAKSFHRPFEQWGMAYNLTSRIFCAAAIYAWQLIFSHTPFDDAKQRDLPTREDRQARLERVAERNEIILDCYGVRSEREWMREATKDLSFVSQIYMPNYPGDDPAQEKECRDNYDFVKNFLFQCFPNINKLHEIPDFLVGAGIFFVLKEVFHVSKDAPLTRRLQKYAPHILVKGNEDYLYAVTPASSALYAGADNVGSDDENDDNDQNGTTAALSTSRTVAAPTSLATPRATDYGRSGNGLSGLQRAVLLRYEQLRQLYHLSYGMLDEEERAACAWSDTPLSDKSTLIQPSAASSQPSLPKPLSPSGAAAKSTSFTDKEKTKRCATSTNEDHCAFTGTGSNTCVSASDDAASATSPIRRYMVHSGAGPVTPLRATPTTKALSSAFNTPAAMREGPRGGSAGNESASRSAARKPTSAATPSPPKRALPPRDSDVRLAHVPHRLLRPSSADVQFVREFEEEVSKSVRNIVDGIAGSGSNVLLNSAELTAKADVHDALDIAYPDHFLVKLSEMLAFELFGLHVSLGSCEDLDSTSS